MRWPGQWHNCRRGDAAFPEVLGKPAANGFQ
jgi:hypothetical protein